jgi:hypothetical protein
MSIQKLVVATAWMAAGCFGGTRENHDHIIVYLSDSAGVNNLVKAQAQGTASQMFASVGLTIDWHLGRPGAGEKGAIGIEFVTNTPTSLLAGALAYTRPYEGVHIQIFWDRIRGAPLPNKVLAHVIVHEITHILEGIARHSEEGVMKAQWGESDFGAMGFRPLPFAPEDVTLMRLGVQSWDSRMMATVTHAERESIAVLTARK